MNDQGLFRQGKLILRVRQRPDGTVLLYKPNALKEAHIMSMTGAPGWDKRYVDQVFAEGVRGDLQYTLRNVTYTIPIEDFRRFAFERDGGLYGQQYHCQASHYSTGGWKTRDLSLKIDEVGDEIDYPVLPVKLVFGETALCPKCKALRQKKRCTRCNGLGVVPNVGPIPLTAPDGL